MVPLTTPSRVSELCSFITEKQNLQALLMSLPYLQRSGVVKAYLPITTVLLSIQIFYQVYGVGKGLLEFD